MAVLMIDHVEMPSPSAMKVTVFDVTDGAQISAAGTAIMDTLGQKQRVYLKWHGLSQAEIQKILRAVGENTFFEAAYPDPVTGEVRSIQCYVSDREMNALRMRGGVPVWADMQLTLTQR